MEPVILLSKFSSLQCFSFYYCCFPIDFLKENNLRMMKILFIQRSIFMVGSQRDQKFVKKPKVDALEKYCIMLHQYRLSILSKHGFFLVIDGLSGANLNKKTYLILVGYINISISQRILNSIKTQVIICKLFVVSWIEILFSALLHSIYQQLYASLS